MLIKFHTIILLISFVIFTSCGGGDETIPSNGTSDGTNGGTTNNGGETGSNNLTINGHHKPDSLFSPAIWMSYLKDDCSVASLSIPGTHDSGTNGVSSLFASIARCQNSSIETQLNQGIRFLDIRLKENSGNLSVYHGILSCNLTYNEVLAQCKSFLSTNPKECILMMVSAEDGSGIEPYFSTSDPIYYIGTKMPLLKDVRGKIIFMRRFSSSRLGGIDLSAWRDNTTFTISGLYNEKYFIEDEYNQTDRQIKYTSLTNNIKSADESSDTKIYMSYSSISGSPKTHAWTSDGGMNIRLKSFLTDYLSVTSPRKLGIVIMDFYNEDDGSNILAPQIINSNF